MSWLVAKPWSESERERERAPYLAMFEPSGSSLRMARTAVGAMKETFTPCWLITRQYAPLCTPSAVSESCIIALIN